MKLDRLSALTNSPFKIVFCYIFCGAFWIIFSDLLMGQLVPERLLVSFSIAKGWLFIAFTTLPLYFIIKRQLANMEQVKVSIQEQQQFTEKLIEHSAAAIFVLNSQHKVIIWNKACEELTGFTATFMIGTGNHWQAFYDHERPSLADIVLDAANDKLSGMYSSYEKSTLVPDGLHAEGWYYDLNGHDRYIQFDAAPVYDNRGEMHAVIETLYDVTAQKLADELLRARESQQKALLNNIPDIAWVKDSESRFLAVNEAFGRACGRRPDDLIGQTDFAIWPDELARGYQADDREVMASGSIKRVEEPLANSERRIIWIETIKSPMFDADGQVIGTVGIARDITERKQADETLRLQGAALHAAANAIVITDRGGSIKWVNPAFTELTGYSAEEAMGNNPRELIKSGVHDKAFYEQLWGTILKGEVWRGQIMNRHKDGSLYPEEQTITPVKDDNGAITHFIAIKRDLTEQRKIEEQLRQSQKMESVGTLAGGIAHDFNNILSAIIGYGELTLMKMAVDDQLRSYIESMLEAANRAAVLTKDLLLFSRKRSIDKKQVDLNLIIARVDKFLTKIIGEDITYSTHLHEEPLPVLADGNQLEQVLINLATNARDSMPGGGILTVTTEPIILNREFVETHGYLTPGSFALITVSDNGEGMDEATRQRIFEPFFTTKEVGKGTGLGLATSYGIIKQHEGYITVYSEPGAGSTFRIYLPLTQSLAADEPLDLLEETPPGGTETILIAEDDEAIRGLTTKLLTEFGYTVIEAGDGLEAVTRFNEKSAIIDLILTDLIMPNMNGKEVVDEIRKARPEIKVIFSSGYAPDILQDKVALEDGLNMITKPVSPRELLRMVRRVLDGEP